MNGIHTRQAIVIIGRKDSIYATLRLYQRSEGTEWRFIDEMPAVLGRNGLTDDKREGDGKTPIGCFQIGTAFGTDPSLQIVWPYRLAGPCDYWVDDPDSPDYNRWVEYSGDPNERWKSYERLAIPLYEHALVIRYNEDPVIPGKGSAIFFHRWSDPDIPSAGCITASEENTTRVLRWLQPKMNPVLAIKEGS